MFDLYQLTRLLSLRSSDHQNHGKVVINQFAWKEEGEISFLALLCSNDKLLLRYSIIGKNPIIKQIPWPPDKRIASLCFDSTLSWLMIITESSQEIIIIPALSIVDPNAIINCIFKTDDVTIKQFEELKGKVSSGLWWQTLDGRQVAVIATDSGEIVFVDLLQAVDVETSVALGVPVTGLSIAQDDLQMNTTLLITTTTGNQWKLLLETKSNVAPFSTDSDITEMDYENIDARTIPPRTITDVSERNSEIFQPIEIQGYEETTHLRPQFTRGRHFITAHCPQANTLQVMDADAEYSPLFVYRLPVGSDNVILTDKLLLTVMHDSRERRVVVLSNQRSENLTDDDQGYNTDAIIQEFTLPEGESLLGVERKRYPFYFHDHRENDWSDRVRAGSIILPMASHVSQLDSEVLGIPLRTHTVLEGCIIITDYSIYEIRPCVSPERLFLHLALTLADPTRAEHLAISVGLDLTSLSELAADFLLRQGSFSRAMKLYTLSKCPATKRTGGLARYGCIAETLVQLRQVLSSPSFELNTSERKFLSNMLIHCFVHQLHTGEKPGNVMAGLSDFLSGSFSFDEQTALSLLSDFGQVELTLTLAKARGLVMEGLATLVQAEAFPDMTFPVLADLVHRGFTAHLVQCGKGTYLPCLPPASLVRLLAPRPYLALHNAPVLRPLLPSLDPPQLLELARIFDPSKSVMRGTIGRLHSSPRRRTNSLTSLCSVMSDMSDGNSENKGQSAESLLELFLITVLYLNLRRRQNSDEPKERLIEFDSIVKDPLFDSEKEANPRRASEVRRKLSVQVKVLGSGPRHAAAIRNGDLYTWGRSQNGRLGHGDIPHAVCPPVRVETLHILKLKVESVACGNDHTLALTQQGVYGWGSSKYGQVGVGTRNVYRRPMLLETLQAEVVVSIDVGVYHSMALTHDHQTYTWGWGVHGQLGHGDVEDALVPTHVRDLLSVGVVKVAGGYGHSLALTDAGDVFAFGSGYFGQLGQGNNSKSSRPLKVPGIPQPVANIATKYFHSIAVTTTNFVYTWGAHPYSLRQQASAIRQSKAAGRYIPEQTSFMKPTLVDTTYVHGKIVKVCCGSLHTVLVAEEGDVFAWGRNQEGQLGTGSRLDERLPKMISGVNDQNVLGVSSGGEFTLAVNADGGVWMWGKNDSGQLGSVRGRRESSKLGASHRSPQHSQEVCLPSELKALPASDPSDPWWSAALVSIGADNVWSDNQSSDSENILESLPHLDTLGAHVYDSCVIPVMLKSLERLCPSSPTLQMSVDLEDWLVAGHVSCLEGDLVQAFHYRVKAVTEHAGGVINWESSALCAKLVAHHIQLVQAKAAPASHIKKELQRLCSFALFTWQDQHLDINHLETIFAQHLAPLSTWLLQIVLGIESISLESSAQPFSAQFALKVVKSAMAPSQSEARSPLDWRALLASRGGASSLPLGGAQMQGQEKLTPRDRLLPDIVKNMRKESSAITLSHSQVAYIDEQDQYPSKSVVFSCGHQIPESTFLSSSVAGMVTELTSGSIRLPSSAAFLESMMQRPGLKPSACPTCVLRGLRMS